MFAVKHGVTKRPVRHITVLCNRGSYAVPGRYDTGPGKRIQKGKILNGSDIKATLNPERESTSLQVAMS